MLLGWFAVRWLQYAFMLFKHLHKKCAAASSSNHQESKRRSCSFSSGPFFPVLPGGWLCSAASRDFSLSFLYHQLLIDPPCSIFPSFYSSRFTGLKCWSWDPKHPDSYDPGSAACFSCSPHPGTVFFHNAHSGDAPQLSEGSPLSHTFSCFELSHC